MSKRRASDMIGRRVRHPMRSWRSIRFNLWRNAPRSSFSTGSGPRDTRHKEANMVPWIYIALIGVALAAAAYAVSPEGSRRYLSDLAGRRRRRPSGRLDRQAGHPGDARPDVRLLHCGHRDGPDPRHLADGDGPRVTSPRRAAANRSGIFVVASFLRKTGPHFSARCSSGSAA